MFRLIIIALILIPSIVFTQGRGGLKVKGEVYGTVIDSSSSSPMEYVSVALYNTKDKATLIAASSYANLSALFNKETGIITHVTNRDKCTIIHRFYDQWEPTHVHISLHPEQITLEFDNTNLGLTFMPTTAFNLEKIAA